MPIEPIMKSPIRLENDDAVAMWNELWNAMLESHGERNPIYGLSLAVTSLAYGDYVRCVRNMPDVISDEDRPMLDEIMEDSRLSVVEWLDEMLLTPEARSRVERFIRFGGSKTRNELTIQG